jgi:hypothetical protein
MWRISPGIHEKWRIAIVSLFSLVISGGSIHDGKTTEKLVHFRVSETIEFPDAIQCLEADMLLEENMDLAHNFERRYNIPFCRRLCRQQHAVVTLRHGARLFRNPAENKSCKRPPEPFRLGRAVSGPRLLQEHSIQCAGQHKSLEHTFDNLAVFWKIDKTTLDTLYELESDGS